MIIIDSIETRIPILITKMSNSSTSSLNSSKKILLERKAHLLATSDSSKEERKPVELDQQSIGRLSRMDAMQQQAMAIANETERQNEILRIENALKRIENDEYGICVSCGEDIAIKRLEVNPTTFLCIECAK